MVQVGIIALLASAAARLSPDITEQQAVAIADAYRLFAAKAGGSVVIGPEPSLGPPVFLTEDIPGDFSLRYSDGLIWVSKATGKVTGCSLRARTGFSETWDSEHALTENQVLSFANQYYQQAGFTGTLTLRGMAPDDDMGGPPNVLHAVLAQNQNGIELFTKYDVPLYIEHVTGRLISVDFPAQPNPCTNTTANISAVAALFNFLTYITQKTGESNFIIGNPMHQVLWVPDGNSLTDGFNQLPAHLNIYKQANQGYLIYWCLLKSTQSSMGNGMPKWFFGFVDSHTGAVLGANVPQVMGGSGKFVPKSFDWNLGPGPIEVITKDGSSIAQSADIHTAPVPKSKPTEGKAVCIRRANVVMNAEFDRKSQLIWTDVKGKRIYGRPSPGLLRVLKTKLR